MPSTPRRVRAAGDDARSVMPEAAVCLPGGQVLGLRRQQLLREDAREWLAGPHHLAGGVDVELFDPARTRVWTCEMRDSSGTTVATARMVCVSDSRPTVFDADAEGLHRGRRDLDGHAIGVGRAGSPSRAMIVRGRRVPPLSAPA